MDEKKSPTKQGLQVVGAGLPRTATTSLHQALESLDYKPCHTFRQYIIDDIFPYTHSRSWQKACLLRGEANKPARQALIRKLYDDTGVLAAVDSPTCLFIDDLIEMYPDAKVILGVRSSPAKWRASFNDTIGRVMRSRLYFTTFLFPHMRLALQPILKRFDELSRYRYGAGWTDWESVECYELHNAWVRSVVPKERLLEFEPSMGYEAICEFLGVEFPRGEDGEVKAFPRTNESEGFTKALNVFEIVGVVSWGLVIWGVVATVRYLGVV